VSNLVDELQRVPLFDGLSKRQLRKLARAFKERAFGPGRTVVRQGHMDGVGFFVVVEGDASVLVDGEQLGTLAPGDYFGELAMITKRERAATVVAVSQLRCLVMPFWDFRSFAQDNPELCWKLLQRLADLLIDAQSRLAQASARAG
jgi:CRP-like cAMP-binding protein